MNSTVAPEANKSAFHCPLCLAYANQTWKPVKSLMRLPTKQEYREVPGLQLSICDHCHKFSVWLDGEMVFPHETTAPASHPDMPPKVKTDFEEARSVFADSPRSSAALLRLAIQKLCIELGLPGKNLNDDIGELGKRGLPVRVQQSLDIVRVVGNNQVHPGVLDVRDDVALATTLFGLVNYIVESQIAGPKHVAALYGKLPENARKAIEERDAKAKAQP